MSPVLNSDFGVLRWMRAAVVAAAMGAFVAAHSQTPPPIAAPPSPLPTIGNPSQAAAPAKAEEDIRDIRGPRHIPYSWLWAAYLAGGLAAAGLLAWAYRRWKNRPKIVVKLPHEIALEQLQAALALMNPGQTREFSIMVSDAVRVYIEARFEAKAAHRTTEEFLHQLLFEVMSPLAPYSDSLRDFLQYCDLAKFAKWSLSMPEMQSMHESARKFIEETKPQPGAAAERKLPPEFATPPAAMNGARTRSLPHTQPPILNH